jgi:four helix bundle protein
MGVRHFRELECWQLANELKQEVYKLIATHPAKSDRDFCDDIRRSARSATANISEGFRRFGHLDFARFLSNALGSLAETENHLLDAVDSGYLSRDEGTRLTTLAERAQKTAQRLHSYCLSTPNQGRPTRRRRT